MFFYSNSKSKENVNNKQKVFVFLHSMTMEEEINRANYNDESIKSLKWNEHIRLRPGMYIGKLGDGASPDDGIYILIKEVNSGTENS